MKQVAAIILISFFYSWIKAPSEEVKWNYSVRKIGDKTYEIHLTPAVAESWHIYSQTNPEDVGWPTTIRFNKNPLITLVGKTREVGKVVSEYQPAYGISVKYFEGKCDFVQIVKGKAGAKTKVSGTIEFMACTNEQCTAPQTVSFSVMLN